MEINLTLTIAAFAVVSCFVVIFYMLTVGRKDSLQARLDGVPGEGLAPQLTPDISYEVPAARAAALLMPEQQAQRKRLRDRLVQAGMYKQSSATVYLLAKLGLMVLPVVLGLLASGTGLLTVKHAIFIGCLVGGVGTIVPGFWIEHLKAKRQTEIRRALPDALDVIVVCVEGGLSLPGAIARVSSELRGAHRTLAAEMGIVQREIQLGRSTGEAMRSFADRFDVEELRSLAAVILQAERFGASVVKALRVHAEGLRLKRKQRAEEMAQKASVKLVFPTIFFIFPALFVVIIGPAVFDIIKMFQKINP